MVKVVVNYWIKEIGENKLLSGFHHAFNINPYPSILNMDRTDWQKYLTDAYYNHLIDTEDKLENLRFYVFMVSGKPKGYECLYPGYDGNGKVLKVLKYGSVV